MIDDNHIDVERDQVRLIQDIIGSYHPSAGAMAARSCESRDFLYEIVANKRNGIDVDKVCQEWDRGGGTGCCPAHACVCKGGVR
jgi:hypothetical protein